MSAVEPFCQLFGVNPKRFSREESIFIEIDLFVRIYERLKEYFSETYKNHNFINLNKEVKNMELEKNLIKIIINDITSTENYTLQGIANYANIHLDIVSDLAAGLNTKPLAIYFRRIIELHRLVRPELYGMLAQKIISEYESFCNIHKK